MNIERLSLKGFVSGEKSTYPKADAHGALPLSIQIEMGIMCSV